MVVRHRWSGAVLVTKRTPKGTFRALGVQMQEDIIMGLIKRVQVRSENGVAKASKPARMAAQMPLLTAHLFDDTFEDGELRQRSTLTIMAGDTFGIKAVLNNRQEQCSLWATGDDVEDTLLTMEELLDKPDAPWRQDKKRPGPKKP